MASKNKTLNITLSILLVAFLSLCFVYFFITTSFSNVLGEDKYYYENWDFEGETEYYQLSSYFEYDASLTYYSSDGTNYVEDATVTLENFADKLAAGLYMTSDDADTYWGHKAADYKDGNPSAPCITLNLKLIVSQKQ